MNYFEAYMEEEKTDAIAVQEPFVDARAERLIKLGANAEQLERLLGLQERREKDFARKAFYESMLTVKANPPQIVKSTGIALKPGAAPAYYYSPLNEVCAAIIPVLAAQGITHRWEVSYEGDWMYVSCILTHRLGHSERTTMRGKADSTGSKNAIQAEGSTKTYLERYTLLGAVGLAAQGMDTDANINVQFQPEPKMFDKCTTQADLQKEYYKLYKEAHAAGNKPAMQALEAQAKKRKEELQRSEEMKRMNYMEASVHANPFGN